MIVSSLGSVAGMLSAVSVLVYVHDMGSSHPQNKDSAGARMQVEVQKVPGIRRGAGDRDVFRRRAEAAAHEAAGRREKQTEKDLKAAIALFQKSVQGFKDAGLEHKAADATLQIGEIYFTLSQYHKALSSYQQAVRLAGRNPELLCLVLSRMARTYATTGQKSEADKSSNEALSQCRELSDRRLEAEGLQARGEALAYSGDLQGGAPFFSRAQELFGEATDKVGQAQALLLLAYSRWPEDRAEALQLAGEALRLWSSSGDRHGVAKARAALGIFAAATDEFETAQCNYEQSLPVFHRVGDKDNEAATLNGLGLTSRETGDVEASLENFTRAKDIFTGVHDDLGVVEAITGMGKTLSTMRRYQQLLPLYRAKLRLARQTKNIGQEASALADLAGVYELQHQYAKARTLYERSVQAYISAKRDYGAGDILVRLALLYVRQGGDSQALGLLERARDLKDKSGQVEDVARIDYELADIYRRLKRLQDARTAIEKTIGVIESQRLKIARFDSRAAYFSSVHKYYALYIQILMLLDQRDPQHGLRQTAFEASEKSKVRALIDLLNASKEGAPCDELLQRQLAPANSSHAPDAEHEVPTTPVLTLQQIQENLGSEDTVLEYALGDKKSYVWLVDSNQITAYDLPPANMIEKLVQVFRKVLTAREPLPGENSIDKYKQRIRNADAAYPRLARELSQLLLGPVNLASAKRLLIVPDGSLQYIPFSALPLAQLDKSHAPLMSNHEVVVLPSASALNALRQAAKKRDPPTHTAVIIADPVVERDDPRVPHLHNAHPKKSQEGPPALKTVLRDIEAQYITRLPGSRAEARAIEQALDAQDVVLATDFGASRDKILQGMLEHYRFVHFATHGIIDVRRPEMSGLVLSLVNERGQSQNGYLRLGDIYKLRLSADLVVLSACNSALGKELESEGIIGLPRGFLYAGSRSVIASLWKVEDEAAADFMRGFYARIKQGKSPSAALRGTQLEMSRERRWKEPFYWAAFVLQGDYK